MSLRPRCPTATSATAGADAAHPAFSKMFVQTESVEQGGILPATRRRRTPDEAQVWAVLALVPPLRASDACDQVLAGALTRAIASESDPRTSSTSSCLYSGL